MNVQSHQLLIFVPLCSCFKDPVESTSVGKNVTVPEGGNTTFSCPVDGNPKPNISWYRGIEISEMPISSGEQLEAKESGCYTCVASSSLGKPVIITQCLIFGT